MDALDAGADDCITKPFGWMNFGAAARLVRRSAGPDQEPGVTTEAFTMDLGKHRVARDGRDIRLTPTEWKMLEVLVRNPEKLVTQQ